MEPYFEQTNVFVGGKDGVNTYRIPSLMVTSQGTLLAFCEARKISKADASPTDMVLKRSEDGGRSWSAVQRVLGAAGEEAVMNPCPVIDGDTVFLFCINAHKTSPGHHRQLLVKSDDEGRTWSSPEDLTEQIIPADDTFVPGPAEAKIHEPHCRQRPGDDTVITGRR